MAIQIRRGTNTEWESNNSNIVVGEPAIATDAERFFVGTASGDYAEFANLDIIAPAYDTFASYVVGDVINRQGKLYSCNTPCSGSFNVSYWDEKSLAEILKDLENEIDYAQYEIGYASGELITIDNGASEIPVKDLTLDIEAVQDLHGYDNPWVGGAGKNLLDSQASITISGTGYYKDIVASSHLIGSCELEADVTYTLSLEISGAVQPFMLSVGVGGGSTYSQDIQTKTNLNNGRVDITFTPTATQLQTYKILALRCPRYNASQTLSGTITKIQLEKSATMTAYEPYENICPISGWDEVNVCVAGKNLWTGDSFITKATGSFYIGTGNTLASAYPISIPKGTVYFSADWQGVGAGQEIQMFYADGTKKRFGTNPIPANSHFERSVTLEKDAVGIFAYINQAGTLSNIMLTYEENADYAPYNGQVYTTDLDGTRYGGTLDVTTGVLTVTHEYIDLGTYGISGTAVSSNVRRWYTTQNPVFKKVTLCNSLKTSDSYVYTSLDYASISTDKRIAVTPTWGQSITTVADFNTAIANNPISVVIELATPQVVQLTPAQVRTVLGTNNIWNQMNSNNELAYRISNALN